MADMKKIPVVLQNGEETPITTANAYRMQHRAMLEAFGISSMEEFENMDPELKKSIPFFPEYAEVGQSRAGSAMTMMRALTDAAIMQRLNHVAELVANIPSKMDFNNLTAFINNFSNSHVEFVGAFKDFIASVKSGENETVLEAKTAETSDPEASKLMEDLKAHTGEISDLADELHNLADEMYERVMESSYMDGDDDDYEEESSGGNTSNRSACPKIVIKGNNYGRISIGDYNMTEGGDKSSFPADVRWPHFCDGNCCEDDDDEEDEDEDDDYGDDDSIYRSMLHLDEGNGPFAGTGCEPASAPIPVGIVDDAKLAAYLLYVGTANLNPNVGVPFSIFHTKSLEETVAQRYPSAAILKLGNDITDRFRLIRSEYVQILKENLSTRELYYTLTRQIATALVLDIRAGRSGLPKDLKGEARDNYLRKMEVLLTVRINRMIKEIMTDVTGLRSYLADDEDLCQLCKEPDDLLPGYLDRDECCTDCRRIDDQIDKAAANQEKIDLTTMITTACNTNIFAPEFTDRCKEIMEAAGMELASPDQARCLGILVASLVQSDLSELYNTIYQYARAEFRRYAAKHIDGNSITREGNPDMVAFWLRMCDKVDVLKKYDNIFRPTYIKKVQSAVKDAISAAYTTVMDDLRDAYSFEPDRNPGPVEDCDHASEPDTKEENDSTDQEG